MPLKLLPKLFQSSSQKPKPDAPRAYGFEDELLPMLNSNLTLRDAARDHQRKWRLTSSTTISHDAMHLVYALMLLKRHATCDSTTPYQADLEAEMVISAMEYLLHMPYYKDNKAALQKAFLTEAQKLHSKDWLSENAIRTMLWMLEEKLGKPAINIFKDCEYSMKRLANFARKQGYIVHYTMGTNNFTSFFISDGEQKYGLHSACSVDNQWPQGSNGTHDFSLFEVPSHKEMSALFDLYWPFLNYFYEHADYETLSKNMLTKKEELFSKIRMRDVYALIHGHDYQPPHTPDPAPEHGQN